MFHNKEFKNSQNVGSLLSNSEERLKVVGIKRPKFESRLLMARAMGEKHPALLNPNSMVSLEIINKFEYFLTRRESRKPISRIFGEREFWGLKFKINSATLDPRPDSETIIESALDAFHEDHPPLKILDLGTGSGCLICSLLKEFPSAVGYATDISYDAIFLAQRNAIENGLEARANFIVGDWDSAINSKFDLIVSNPPYILSSEIDALEPEVSVFDPRMALDGGIDGLVTIRRLVKKLSDLAAPGARIFIEVGLGQADQTAALLESKGFFLRPHARDLAGRHRVVRAEA